MCQRSKEDVLDVLNSNSRDRSHFYKLSPKMVEFINCREINCRRLVAENINGTETIVPFFFFSLTGAVSLLLISAVLEAGSFTLDRSL